MTRVPEFGKRVRALRDALGLKKQEALAQEVGVSITAVSAWERGEYEPAADKCVLLGNLAARAGLLEDALWFWKRAGLDEKAMLSAVAGKVKPHQLVAGLLRELPANAGWHIVQAESAGAFAEGDRFLIEPAKEPRDPRPFWNQVVLVEFAPPREETKERGWPVGLHVGRLRYKEHVLDYEELNWTVTIGLLNDSDVAWDSRDEAIPIGAWRHPGASKDQGSAIWEALEAAKKAGAHLVAVRDEARKGGATIRETPKLIKAKTALAEAEAHFQSVVSKESRRAREEAKEQAPEELRLAEGVAIIGRVIAWFAALGRTTRRISHDEETQ